MGNTGYLEEANKRLDDLEESVKELASSQNFNGLKIWTIESDTPIELSLPKKEAEKEFERLKQAVIRNKRVIQISDFCVVIDKITSFKKQIMKG